MDKKTSKPNPKRNLDQKGMLNEMPKGTPDFKGGRSPVQGEALAAKPLDGTTKNSPAAAVTSPKTAAEADGPSLSRLAEAKTGESLPASPGKGTTTPKTAIGKALQTTVGKITAGALGLAAVAAVAVGIISALNPVPDISGTWIFQTTETGECGHTYDGWTIPVWQKGHTFHGNVEPQPVVTDGKISGNQVTFSIIVYPKYDQGDGNFTDLEGTIDGNTISGTLSGHNGGNSCFWDGDFTVTISH